MGSNREQILNSAALLFGRRGIAATSMDDIAAHSKAAKSNVYYHFSSKANLVEAVRARQGELYLVEIAPHSLRNTDLPPLARLQAFCEHAQNCVALLGTTLEGEFANCVREGIAEGSLRTDLDPELFARALVVYLEGARRMTPEQQSRMRETTGAVLGLLRPPQDATPRPPRRLTKKGR